MLGSCLSQSEKKRWWKRLWTPSCSLQLVGPWIQEPIHSRRRREGGTLAKWIHLCEVLTTNSSFKKHPTIYQTDNKSAIFCDGSFRCTLSVVRVQTTFIGAGGGAQLGFLRQHVWLVTKTPWKWLTKEYKCPITLLLPKHPSLVFLANIFKPHHESSALQALFSGLELKSVVEQRGPVPVGANNLPCDRPATGINRLSKSN